MPPLLFSCVVTVSQVVGHQVACSYWPRYSCMAFEHWAHPLICPTTFSLESIVKESKISELVKNKEALENKSLRELSDEVEALDRQLQEEKMS